MKLENTGTGKRGKIVKLENAGTGKRGKIHALENEGNTVKIGKCRNWKMRENHQTGKRRNISNFSTCAGIRNLDKGSAILPKTPNKELNILSCMSWRKETTP